MKDSPKISYISFQSGFFTILINYKKSKKMFGSIRTSLESGFLTVDTGLDESRQGRGLLI